MDDANQPPKTAPSSATNVTNVANDKSHGSGIYSIPRLSSLPMQMPMPITHHQGSRIQQQLPSLDKFVNSRIGSENGNGSGNGNGNNNHHHNNTQSEPDRLGSQDKFPSYFPPSAFMNHDQAQQQYQMPHPLGHHQQYAHQHQQQNATTQNSPTRNDPDTQPPPRSGSAPPPQSSPLSSDEAQENKFTESELEFTVRARKPYTKTNNRQVWTQQEHTAFLEALELYGRDWKNIEKHIGTKAIPQIMSHAQKHFLKVQKKNTGEVIPPPRPKKKASKPYPRNMPLASATTSRGADHSVNNSNNNHNHNQATVADGKSGVSSFQSGDSPRSGDGNGNNNAAPNDGGTNQEIPSRGSDGSLDYNWSHSPYKPVPVRTNTQVLSLPPTVVAAATTAAPSVLPPPPHQQYRRTMMDLGLDPQRDTLPGNHIPIMAQSSAVMLESQKRLHQTEMQAMQARFQNQQTPPQHVDSHYHHTHYHYYHIAQLQQQQQMQQMQARQQHSQRHQHEQQQLMQGQTANQYVSASAWMATPLMTTSRLVPVQGEFYSPAALAPLRAALAQQGQLMYPPVFYDRPNGRLGFPQEYPVSPSNMIAGETSSPNSSAFAFGAYGYTPLPPFAPFSAVITSMGPPPPPITIIGETIAVGNATEPSMVDTSTAEKKHQTKNDPPRESSIASQSSNERELRAAKGFVTKRVSRTHYSPNLHNAGTATMPAQVAATAAAPTVIDAGVQVEKEMTKGEPEAKAENVQQPQPQQQQPQAVAAHSSLSGGRDLFDKRNSGSRREMGMSKSLTTDHDDESDTDDSDIEQNPLSHSAMMGAGHHFHHHHHRHRHHYSGHHETGDYMPWKSAIKRRKEAKATAAAAAAAAVNLSQPSSAAPVSAGVPSPAVKRMSSGMLWQQVQPQSQSLQQQQSLGSAGKDVSSQAIIQPQSEKVEVANATSQDEPNFKESPEDSMDDLPARGSKEYSEDRPSNSSSDEGKEGGSGSNSGSDRPSSNGMASGSGYDEPSSNDDKKLSPEHMLKRPTMMSPSSVGGDNDAAKKYVMSDHVAPLFKNGLVPPIFAHPIYSKVSSAGGLTSVDISGTSSGSGMESGAERIKYSSGSKRKWEATNNASANS